MSLIDTTMFAIVTFDSTADAMAGEQSLLQAKIENLVLPLPTAISASCGLAIRVYPADKDTCRAALEKDNIPYHLYLGVKNGKQESYDPL